MAQHSFIDMVKAARRVGTPLIAVRTPDQAATMQLVASAYADAKTPVAILVWDVVRGLLGVNKLGEEKQALLLGSDAPDTLSHPVTMLTKANDLEECSILFMLNAHRYFDQPAYVQAIWNLRDQFKANERTLILLAPSIVMPAELSGDVMVLDEPYPTRAQLEDIIKRAHKESKAPQPDEDLLERGADALCGLAAFPAEQSYFMSIDPKTKQVDMDMVQDRKRKQIEQTHGLTTWRGKEKFSDIVGLTNIKRYLAKLLRGKRKISCILFLDEIEKMFAGVQGDLSGTSQEMFGAFLSWMQDHNVVGLLLLGPPGTGKSLLAKAAGNEVGIPTMVGDISGMKGSFIGESGENIRNALKVADAVSGGKTIMVIATCNSVESLPPELRRRFKSGTFFMDLMDDQEREAAWKHFCAKYELSSKNLPQSKDWTAAEIEQCCELAWSLEMTLQEAAEYIVPVAMSAKEQIARLRDFAKDRFISASKPGKYQPPQKQSAVPQGRSVSGGKAN